MALLLPTREAQAGPDGAILDLLPQRSLVDDFSTISSRSALRRSAIQAWTVGHIIIDTLGEWIRALENHPDPPADIYHIHTRGVDIISIQADHAWTRQPGLRSFIRLKERREWTCRSPRAR